MELNNDYFIQIEQLQQSMEKMLQPIREIDEQYKSMLRSSLQIDNPLTGINEQVAASLQAVGEQVKPMQRLSEQLNDIMKPFREQVASVASLNDILSSYNATRDFVSNYDDYVDELDSIVDKDELSNAKDAIREMPDIEEKIEVLTPEQTVQVEEISVRTYRNLQEIDAEKQQESEAQQESELSKITTELAAGWLASEEFSMLIENIPVDVVDAIVVHVTFVYALFKTIAGY